MSGLTLKDVRKSFGSVEVLHGVDIDVADGEIVVLVGPSGCGKSTLLRLIAGLERITEGEFLMDGRRINEVAPAKRGIGTVFQSYALYPHMTVRENISFGLRLRRTARSIVDARVREVANTLQLGELLDRKPRELSGGQRQRVAIGRALVQQPEIFLFDEPLSNLDAKLRVSMRVEIAKLHKKLHSTMIYVTHDQVEALTLADRIVVMNNGQAEQIGTPLELYYRPANLFVAGFIGSPRMNFVDGEVTQISPDFVTVQTDPGFEVTSKVDGSGASVGDRVTIGIRPEHAVERESGANVLRGTVEVVEHLGELTYLYMTIGDLPEHFVVKIEGTSLAREGEEIGIGFEPGGCYLFDRNGSAFRRIGTELDALKVPLQARSVR